MSSTGNNNQKVAMGDTQLDNWKRIIKLVTGHYWESYIWEGQYGESCKLNFLHKHQQEVITVNLLT